MMYELRRLHRRRDSALGVENVRRMPSLVVSIIAMFIFPHRLRRSVVRSVLLICFLFCFKTPMSLGQPSPSSSPSQISSSPILQTSPQSTAKPNPSAGLLITGLKKLFKQPEAPSSEVERDYSLQVLRTLATVLSITSVLVFVFKTLNDWLRRYRLEKTV